MTPEHQTIVDAWNAMACIHGLAQVRMLTPARATHLRARLVEGGISGVIEAITRIGSSDFCRGKNSRGWKADLDFVLQAKSFPRILEGAYDNREAPRPKFRNGAIELLAREAEGRYPTIDNVTMIGHGDD